MNVDSVLIISEDLSLISLNWQKHFASYIYLQTNERIWKK